MRKSTDATRPCLATTAESIHDVFCCWTRVEVLIAVTGARMAVAELAAALRLGRPLVSSHLSDLSRAGLLRRSVEGKKHFYELTASARVRVELGGVELSVHADDGSDMSFRIPREARVMRVLGAAMRMAEKEQVVVATLPSQRETRSVATAI